MRLTNTYYSNLIEGHRTCPRDIERGPAGERDDDQRDLMTEAAAHYRVQESIDLAAADGELSDPADPDYIRQLYRDFYAGASEAMLTVRGGGRAYLMILGEWRSRDEHECRSADTFHLRQRASPISWRTSTRGLLSSRKTGCA